MGKWIYRSTFFLPRHWLEVSGQIHAPAAFRPLDRSLVDPRARLEDVEKRKFLTLPGLEPRPLSHPARSQSLYQLLYLGSNNLQVMLPIVLRGLM
jgi:hypothetical protein